MIGGEGKLWGKNTYSPKPESPNDIAAPGTWDQSRPRR